MTDTAQEQERVEDAEECLCDWTLGPSLDCPVHGYGWDATPDTEEDDE